MRIWSKSLLWNITYISVKRMVTSLHICCAASIGILKPRSFSISYRIGHVESNWYLESACHYYQCWAERTIFLFKFLMVASNIIIHKFEAISIISATSHNFCIHSWKTKWISGNWNYCVWTSWCRCFKCKKRKGKEKDQKATNLIKNT